MKDSSKCYAGGCDSNNIDHTCMYGDASGMTCQVNCYNCTKTCKKDHGDIACVRFTNKSMSREKESIELYIPKTLEEAKKLFKKFSQLNLKNLDKEKFFLSFERGSGEIGFCIRNNEWQVCDPECDSFNISEVKI